jgi:PAS domain S-box-containing protein
MQVFFEQSRHFFWMATNAEGIITAVNKNWLKHWGINPETLMGAKAVSFLAVSDRPIVYNAIKLAYQQPCKTFEFKAVTTAFVQLPANSLIQAEIIYRPDANDGKVWAMACYLIDPNENPGALLAYQAEKATLNQLDKALLHNSMLSYAIEQSPVSVMITNSRAEIEYVNAHFCNLTGYSREEVYGKNPSILKSGETGSEIYRELWQTLQKGKPWSGFFSNRKKDGTFYWEYAVVSPVYNDKKELTNYIAVKEDITGRRILEKKLSLSETRLKLATSGTNTGLWDLQFDTNQIYYSPEWASLLGYSLEELQPITPDTFKSLVHPDDFAETKKRLDAVLQGIEPAYESELRMKHKKGHWVWVLDRGRVVERTADGRPLRMIGTHTDITRQKEAEALLRAREAQLSAINERFELATKAGGIGIWVLCFNQNSITVDDLSREMFGLPDGITSISIDDWLQSVHRKDQAMIAAEITRLKHGKGVADLCFRYFMPNGQMKYFNAYARMSNEPDTDALELTGVVYDTTKLNNTQKELQQRERILSAAATSLRKLLGKEELFESIGYSLQQLALGMDVDRTYLYVNEYDTEGKGYFKLTFQWESEAGKNTYQKIYDSIIPFDTMPNFVALLAQNKSLNEVVRTMADKNMQQALQAMKVKSVLVLPLFVEGKFWGFFGFDDVKHERTWSESEYSIIVAFAHALEDALYQKNQEKQLLEARRQADLANKAKSEFLANMSHEIRTPLNGVIGFTELLYNLDLKSTERKYVENIQTSALSLMGIINDILDFSKIEAGKLELDESTNDVIELTEQTVDMVKMAASKKGIELLLNIDPATPRFCTFDLIRLRQILLNLMGNAVKFTKKGEVELSLKFAPDNENPEKGFFTFEVRDTGIGISEQQRQRLFKAFSQADASTTKKYGGTGLGLVISSKLLEQMDSKLELQSTPGQGSIFSFVLHRKCKQGHPVTYKPIEKIERVLIIDDNDQNRLILKHMLQKWNIKTDEAANGEEALRMLQSRTDYDVAIVDYNMPGMNGLELIAEIRKQQLSVPGRQAIVMYTSSEDPDVVKGCQELKVNFRVEKPIKMKELHQVLSSICEVAEAPVQAPEKYETPPLPATTANTVPAAKGPVILVAEDNTINMTLIRYMLQKLYPACILHEAGNGREAIEMYSKCQPDIVLMDMQMPIMDGLNATRNIRKLEAELNKRSAIIALTANAMAGERENCLKAGMDDYLTKPIQQKMLVETLNAFWQPGEN